MLSWEAHDACAIRHSAVTALLLLEILGLPLAIPRPVQKLSDEIPLSGGHTGSHVDSAASLFLPVYDGTAEKHWPVISGHERFTPCFPPETKSGAHALSGLK